MKAFLRRFRYVIASAALAAGAIAPIALQAGPAAAADDSFIINDGSGFQVGQQSGLITDLGEGGSQESNLHFEGTVTSTGGGCWPFACGNGDNAYFQGDNVWLVYQHGTSNCWTATKDAGGNWEGFYTATCGGNHMYSYIVQLKPWDNRSGSESWTDVGADNANNGVGLYLEDRGEGSDMEWCPSACSSDSFHTVVG